MNCQDALELLYDIIDREASEIDTQKVQEHLKNCRDCFEKYRLEQSVQEFINDKVQKAVSTGSVDALKAKILDRLDEIDDEDCSRREPRFFSLTTKTLVAAASFVLLIGAGFLLASFYRHNDIYIPLERAHWSVTEEIDTYRNNDATAKLLSAVASDHQYSLAPTVAEFAMVGGNSKEIMGTEMGHFVYSRGNEVISVFVVPADNFEISSDLDASKTEIDGITFYDHNCRGCRLVYHKIGSLVVITASTNRDVDLLNFVPGLSAI